jgi:hypothetical protein
MFPRQNASSVLSSDLLSHESMLSNSSNRGARHKEALLQRQSPGYIDKDDLMSGVITPSITILVSQMREVMYNRKQLACK